MKHEEITRGIIGAAMAVLNELKPGLDDSADEFPKWSQKTLSVKSASSAVNIDIA